MIFLEKSVIDLEDRSLQRGVPSPIHELAALRKRFTYMRRYKVPLARMLENIARDDSLDMDEDTRGTLKETAAYLMEYQDVVDSYIERADNVRDYLEDQRSERMDKAAFRLTIVATVFLPPTLISGLLGINVAGIPGAQHPSYAFWLVCLILVVLAIVSTVIVLRMIKR
jgi:zinc transporter